MNLVSISFPQYRFTSALVSGVGHLSIGTLHFYRLCVPFDFEVFGHKWSRAASLREVIIVIPFGLLCVVAATTIK
jgi:hypothetical protein